LLAGVLEPLTSALAARSRFSLERFSDVFLVTRAVAELVDATASSARVSFALGATDEQLELTIGPLRPGARHELRASVARLATEVAYETINRSELLRIGLKDHDRDLSTARRAP
jgi:hypothetical protein